MQVMWYSTVVQSQECWLSGGSEESQAYLFYLYDYASDSGRAKHKSHSDDEQG